MRGRIFLALFVVSGMLTSCDFSQEFGDSTQAESGQVGLTVTASADDALSQTVGGLWKSGDELKMRLSGAEYEEGDCVSLLAASGGSSDVSFEGVLPSYRDRDNVYLYFSNDGEFSGTGYSKTVSSVQTGLLEDVLDNVLYYSWARWDAVRAIKEGKVLKSVAIETQMVPMAAMLKINIPVELQARNVRIKASSAIAGTVAVNPQKGWSSVGEDGLLHAQGASDEIAVGGDGVVSGDVYVVVMPDGFDAVSDAYCNAAQTVTLSCDYYEGDLAKRYLLDDSMVCGAVTDLGVLPMPAPKIPVEGGKIRLMPDATLTIGIADANPDCEYYYELGSSEETCAVPTINSAKFDPATGFRPEITGSFDRYFIKVLAHPLDTDYKGVVMTASLRNWKFMKDCPVDAILSKMESGEKLPAIGDTENTAHGLELRRNTLKAAGNYDIGPYESNAARIAYTTARVQINAAMEYDSDAWVGFFIDRNTSVKAGSARGYRFYYNNNQSTDSYWKTSVTSQGTTSERINLCLHLTDIFRSTGIKKGDKFGLRGDGKHVYYGIALLEVL